MSTDFEVRNGNPACETSSDVAPARMSRARGPHSPIVVNELVASNSCAEPSVGQRVGEDLPVAHAHAAAGHDAEPVVREAHDREVGEDPAGLVQERRVDRLARRDVDLVDAQPLEVAQRRPAP